MEQLRHCVNDIWCVCERGVCMHMRGSVCVSVECVCVCASIIAFLLCVLSCVCVEWC